MKEKKARVEDAMHATKAAVEEGIVPGGGVALIRASKALDDLKLGGDQQIGVNIVKRAIEEPMRWIATNAGHEGSIVVQKVREMKDDEGFNALTDTYEDLVKAGVIDPAKVVRSALQNSSSIASLLLTTEALISEIPEEKKEAPADGRRRRHGRDVLKVSKSEVQKLEVRNAKGPAGAILTGPFLLILTCDLRRLTCACRSAAYRSVNVSSIVISTGTGSPRRVPGAKRHCLRGFDGLLIEAEGRVERSHHLHVADRAVGPDDALEQHRALHLRAHRVGGVLRLHFAQHARQRDAVARADRRRRPCRRRCPGPRPEPDAGTDAACRCRFRRRRRCPIPATASAVRAALRSRRAAYPCAAARLFAGMFSCSTGGGSFFACFASRSSAASRPER